MIRNFFHSDIKKEIGMNCAVELIQFGPIHSASRERNNYLNLIDAKGLHSSGCKDSFHFLICVGTISDINIISLAGDFFFSALGIVIIQKLLEISLPLGANWPYNQVEVFFQKPDKAVMAGSRGSIESS